MSTFLKYKRAIEYGQKKMKKYKKWKSKYALINWKRMLRRSKWFKTVQKLSNLAECCPIIDKYVFRKWSYKLKFLSSRNWILSAIRLLCCFVQFVEKHFSCAKEWKNIGKWYIFDSLITGLVTERRIFQPPNNRSMERKEWQFF